MNDWSKARCVGQRREEERIRTIRSTRNVTLAH